MAYLAPDPARAVHSADVFVRAATTLISFTPDSLAQLSVAVRSMFDRAFIAVLVRRLDAVWRHADQAVASPVRDPSPAAETAAR